MMCHVGLKRRESISTMIELMGLAQGVGEEEADML